VADAWQIGAKGNWKANDSSKGFSRTPQKHPLRSTAVILPQWSFPPHPTVHRMHLDRFEKLGKVDMKIAISELTIGDKVRHCQLRTYSIAGLNCMNFWTWPWPDIYL
jgi:hypothetical protein